VNVLVRGATVKDLDAMVRLLGVLFSIESDFRPDPSRQRRGLAMLLGDPRSAVLVAEVQGTVVGMATVQLLVSTAEGDLSGLVEDVVVDESARRARIGTLLVEACEQWARARNATRLQLLADRDNAPALAFYARRGWRHTRLACMRKGGIPTP